MATRADLFLSLGIGCRVTFARHSATKLGFTADLFWSMAARPVPLGLGYRVPLVLKEWVPNTAAYDKGDHWSSFARGECIWGG